MSSSFNISAFQEHSEDSENEDGIPDPEFLNLQNQIAETEASLDKVQSQLEEDKAKHQQDLNEIVQEVEEVKKISENALNQQQLDQKEELKRLQQQYEDEKNLFEHSLEQSIQENQAFAERSREIVILSEQSKITDLQRKAEQERSRHQENASAAESKLLQTTLAKKQTSMSVQNRFHALEREISEIQGNRREAASVIRLKISELTTKIQTRSVEHTTLIRKLEADLQARDKEYAIHIDTVRKQLEKEKQAIETEINSTTVRYQNLQKYYQTMTKRGSQQLSRMTHDIEKMKRDLENISRQEEKTEEERKEKVKMQALGKQVKEHRDWNAAIESEITQTRAQYNTAYSHLRASQTNSNSYMNRKSRNSIF